MAHRMTLDRPVMGMPFIWNVSKHVGDTVGCPNRPTDVNLVKLLITATIAANPPVWVNPKMRLPFHMMGPMDPLTAYWIRVFNADHTHRLDRKEDGVISPARGAQYAVDETWTIVKLNWAAKKGNATGWENLANNAYCLPALRRELAG